MGSFCGFERTVVGPKGGERALRVEVSGGVASFRLDGAVIFSADWSDGLGPQLAELAEDVRVVCDGRDGTAEAASAAAKLQEAVDAGGAIEVGGKAGRSKGGKS